MLGIKISDRFLSLYEDTQLTFEMVHPMGMIIDAGQIIQGGFSFPVTIPLDTTNLEIIGHIDRLDHDVTLLQEAYCEVWIDGVPLYVGRATIKAATATSATLFMVFNDAKDISDTALSALDLGGDRIIGLDSATRLAHAKDTAENPLDYDYVFCPVLNPVYGINDLTESIVFSHLQNHWIQATGEFREGLAAHAMPFVRIDYILTKIFEHIGYTLDNQWQTTDELRLLLIYNNYSILVRDSEGVANRWASTINLTNHVPFRSAIEFLKAIMSTFALGVYLDPIDRVALLKPIRDIIAGPVERDYTSAAHAVYDYTADRTFVSRFRYDVDTDDLLSIQWSAYSYGEILIGLTPEYVTARAAYADSHTGAARTLADNSWYYIYGPPDAFRTTLYRQTLEEIKRTGSDVAYTSQLIPMWMSYELRLDGYIDSLLDPVPIAYQYWLVPHIHHQGHWPINAGLQRPQISMRTMFYRGMQPYDEGTSGTYPMAGISRYNIRGTQVGDYALTWDLEGGIYDAWWKLPYEMLRQKKEVTRLMSWTIRDLVNFRFYHKYRIENQNVIFTRLRFTASHRGISPVEATMITTL